MSNNYIESYLPQICCQSLWYSRTGLGSFAQRNLSYVEPYLTAPMAIVVGTNGDENIANDRFLFISVGSIELNS